MRYVAGEWTCDCEDRWEARPYAADWFELVVRIQGGRIVEAVLRYTDAQIIIGHWVAADVVAQVQEEGIS